VFCEHVYESWGYITGGEFVH